MGASKRTFMEQREYEYLIKEVTTTRFKSQWTLNRKAQRIVKLIPLGRAGCSRDYKDFQSMLQIGWPPFRAAMFCLKPIQQAPIYPAPERNHDLGDYYDMWNRSPDRYDEERDNRL